MNMRSMFSDIITNTAGDATDIAKIMGLLGFLTYLSLEIFSVVWRHQTFNGVDFGAGMAGVVAATGAALRLNPENKQQ